MATIARESTWTDPDAVTGPLALKVLDLGDHGNNSFVFGRLGTPHPMCLEVSELCHGKCHQALVCEGQP